MAFQSSGSGFSFANPTSASQFGSSSQPNIFSAASSNAAASTSTGGLFASASSVPGFGFGSSPSIFGAGSSSSFEAPSASNPLFGPSSAAPSFNTSAGAIFGAVPPSAAPLPPTSSIFGANPGMPTSAGAASSAPLFSSSSPFAKSSAPVFGVAPLASGSASIFNATPTPSSVPSSTPAFAEMPTPSKNLFSTPTPSFPAFATPSTGTLTMAFDGSSASALNAASETPSSAFGGSQLFNQPTPTTGISTTQSQPGPSSASLSISQPSLFSGSVHQAIQQSAAATGVSFLGAGGPPPDTATGFPFLATGSLPSAASSSSVSSSAFNFAAPTTTNTALGINLSMAPSLPSVATTGSAKAFSFNLASGPSVTATPSLAQSTSVLANQTTPAVASTHSIFSSALTAPSGTKPSTAASVPSISPAAPGGSSHGFNPLTSSSGVSFAPTSAASGTAKNPGFVFNSNASAATQATAKGVNGGAPPTSTAAADKASAGQSLVKGTSPADGIGTSATVTATPLGASLTSASFPSIGSSTATASKPVSILTTGNTSQEQKSVLSTPLNVPSDIKDLSLDEVVNKWTEEVADLAKQFQDGAALVSKWDRAIVANEDKIVSLHKDAQSLQIAHKELSNNLDAILSQQTELHTLLDALEVDVERKIGTTAMQTESRSSYSPSPKLYGDVERDSMHRMSLEIMQELDAMALTLRDLVLELNKSRAPSHGDGGAGDTVSQIVSVLNAHLDSLQYLDDSSSSLQKRLADVSRACEAVSRGSDRMYMRRPGRLY